MRRRTLSSNTSKKTHSQQIDKFREAARELETDDSEENFDRVLKKVVTAPPQTPHRDSKKESE